MKHTRAIRFLSFSLSALLLICGVVATVPVNAAGEQSLAKNGEAIACHLESATLHPNYALDGVSSTRFAAGGGCPSDTWLTVDLGQTSVLSSVRINWEAAYATSFAIDLSNDGKSYTEAGRFNTTAAGWSTYTLSGRARFVRLRELSRALPQYGFSIWDMEIMGTPTAENTGVYHVLTLESASGGQITLSDGEDRSAHFIGDGDQVTLKLIPDDDAVLKTLHVNGEDVTAQVKEGQYTLTVNRDTTVVPTFKRAPKTDFECEDATVYNAEGTSVIGVTLVQDAAASGGLMAGSTGMKRYVFENVAESNYISVAYASTNSNYINAYVRYPETEEFVLAGYIPFSTTNSWAMSSSAGYLASSEAIYIPAGSDVMIIPQVDVNLDCISFSTGVLGDQDASPENEVIAEDMTSVGDAALVEDIMATYGKAMELPQGSAATFTVPSVLDTYNVFHLTYCAEEEATVTLKAGGKILGVFTLPATPMRSYETYGNMLSAFGAGKAITVACTGGTVRISSVTVNSTTPAEPLTVTDMPATGERTTVSMNGRWDVASLPWSGKAPAALDGVDFCNTAPVPGVWKNTAYSMGSYHSVAMLYRRILNLEEAPSDGVSVTLNIKRAQYGRYIYINGQLVDTYLYNYSESYTDITKYLKKGDNEIVILLGAFTEQLRDDLPGHVLQDGESSENYPGITDSVYLIMNREPSVDAIETAVNLEKGILDVKAYLSSSTSVTTDISVRVYELGVYENGQPTMEERLVGTMEVDGVSVKGATEFVSEIQLSDFTKDKYWTPDHPYLYRVEVSTSGDTLSVRTGMRTFSFDPDTGDALLNGERIYLMGTNVALKRFYDDPLFADQPWNEDWISKLYSEYKSIGWVCMRTHCGHAGELWYSLADELGFMIIDEYPMHWDDQDGCTLETITPEIAAWMRERCNNPSVIVWDIQNESPATAMVDDIIRTMRDEDPQGRPWENGWRPPVGDTDPIECHPYIMGGGISALNNISNKNPLVTTANIGWTAEQYGSHAFIINEHGNLWLTRDGRPTQGTAGIWAALMPNATNEERLAYYAEAMAAECEFWRAGRAYAGLMFFCGLVYSKTDASGVTGDILMPDISTAESLQINPYAKELLTNAFADLGICIEEYTETAVRGRSVRLPVTLINDTGADITDLPVTLEIRSGETLLYRDTQTMSVSAYETDGKGLATKDFSVTVPAYETYCANGSVLTVTASYTLDGETVSSQRKWKVQGGTTVSDSELPNWEDQPAETTDGAESDGGTDPAEATPETDAPEDTLPDKQATGDKGCGSVVHEDGVLLLLVGLAVACLMGKWRRTKKASR